MTAALVFIVVGLLFAGGVYVRHWWKHRADRIMVEKALTESINKVEAEKAKLPDPEQPLDPKKVSDALNRVRALGREPRKPK